MFCFVFFNKITFYGRVIEVQDDDKGQQQEFSKNGGGREEAIHGGSVYEPSLASQLQDVFRLSSSPSTSDQCSITASSAITPFSVVEPLSSSSLVLLRL